jgi:hypothetical protein
MIKAIKSGKKDLVSNVLGTDFDPNERENGSEKTLLHLCVEYELRDLMRKLLDGSAHGSGRKVNPREKDGSGEVELPDALGICHTQLRFPIRIHSDVLRRLRQRRD